jgi:NitT/TauT family transport system substrate-binding protein
MNRRDLLRSTAAIVAGGSLSTASAATETIHIEFQRFSAFYAPLIVTIAGKYLEAEGLTPTFTVTASGKSSIASLSDGSADVVQSAPGTALIALEKGLGLTTAHFAQINERDGFFLLGRTAEPGFSWPALKGRKMLVNHDTQPLTMFRYACFKRGIDFKEIDAINAGSEAGMIDAFRRGDADFVHLQGPTPQQLQHEGVGHIATAVGDAVGPCAFSSLAADRAWLASEKAKKFVRAYRRARAWMADASAGDIADIISPHFKGVDLGVLTETTAAYQKLGTWSPAVDISRASFDATLDVFENGGLITKRYAYEDVIVPPPG